MFTVVATLDFTSTRARMSVVVRHAGRVVPFVHQGRRFSHLQAAGEGGARRSDAQGAGHEPCRRKTAQARGDVRRQRQPHTVLRVPAAVDRQRVLQGWEKTYQQAVNALEDREALVELAFDELEHSA